MIQRKPKLHDQIPHGTRVTLITDGTVAIANTFLNEVIDGVIMQRDSQEGFSFMVFDFPFDMDSRGKLMGSTWIAPHQVEIVSIH
tara:strand:+ start:199 stop:453 length:255 start_codon:yes stop_codon:yes gene_type:complete